MCTQPSFFDFISSFERCPSLRCCHIFQEKAKAIELPFCTKEIGKEVTTNLSSERSNSDSVKFPRGTVIDLLSGQHLSAIVMK